MSTITIKQDRRQSDARKIPTAAIILGIILFAAIGLGTMMLRMNYVPTELDTATRRITEQGIYQLSYTSDLGAVPINQIQSWTLHVETPDGQPVENASIRVDGDMPQHGHGLPTRPQVTGYLGNGDYKVEGLRFHMPGWWVVDFVVTADRQSDQVRFNLLLK
jgi:hypothetical protein